MNQDSLITVSAPTSAPRTDRTGSAPRSPAVGGAPPAGGPPAPGRDFADVLTGALNARRGIKLSGHAQARLEARALKLTPQDEQRLQAAVDLAAERGARQSLVMLGGLALIVNVPSRTVITAMESDGARGTVFTNIDSAVIAQAPGPALEGGAGAAAL